MSARIKSGVSSAGSRPAGKTLKTSSSSKLLLTVSRPDGSEAQSDEYGLAQRATSFPPGEEVLQLTDEELREEITRTLTTFDPQAPVGLVEFSFKQRCFVPLPPPSHFLTLLDIESICLHRETKEAQEQLARTYIPPVSVSPAATETPRVHEAETGDEEGDGDGDAEGGEGDEAAEGDAEATEEEPAPEPVPEEPVVVEPPPQIDLPVGPPKKLTNQFNFCDRAALTYNNPYRDLGTQTIPPPRTTFSINVTQWAIYDAYKEDYDQQQREREKKEKKEKAAAGVLPKKDENVKRKPETTTIENVVSRQLLSAKIVERMANQNTYDEITQDFKYWEDPSDEFREEEGTLLPLWKLSYDKAKDYNVMSLCWNLKFQDLFAVGFGSFDFREQKADGMMCMFTLKTPSNPEYSVLTESGVMSVDVHPTSSHLVVLGLYDGNVAVYDMQISCTAPQYCSNAISNKHASTVWQVRWGRDGVESEPNFYSVAADGQVFCWTLLQHELAQMTVISLLLPSAPVPSFEGSNISLIGCGTALAFHPTEPMIFLVGTEEGRIYKCSTAYTSIFLATTDAHYMPVHQIDYNKYDASIYASCSGDWRVKIWEDNRNEPLFEFDLASPVGDVAWAPYSSTVFAAATADGKVHVFDLNINKYRPICVQTVVAKKRCRLTRLAFNPKHPVLIVGDNSGCITSVKLSPNLRKKQKPPKKGVVIEHETLEKVKLEKLLALVRDPQNPITVIDNDSTA